MIAFMQVFEDIAKALLLPAINVAVGATIIAALAVIISRLWFLSLPLRHAICVCGVAGAIVASPLIISLESLASRFTEIGTTEWPVRKRTNSELVAAPQQLTQDANLPSASLNHQPATETHAIEVTSSPDVRDDSVTAEAEHPNDTASLSTVKSPLYISIGRVDFGLMFGKLFMFVWIIGSIFFLLRHVVAEIRLRRWLQTCDPIADVETLHAAQSAAMIVGLNDHSPLRRLAVQFRLRRWSTRRGRIAEATALEAVQCAATAVGVEQRPVLLRSNTLPAPVVCGVLKPTLILPETMATGADGLSHDQLAAVLTHEMAHLARRDLVTGLSLTAAKIIYWWNPLIHWLCSHAADLGEQICDDFATTRISQPREYVSALLHFAEQSTHHSTHSSSLGLVKSTMSQLEFRVQRILYSTQSKSLRVGIKNCFVLVFMTTVISAAASMMQICAAEGNEPTAEDEVAQMPETGKALERQEPKSEVSYDPKNDVVPEVNSKTSACFDDHELLITVVNEKGTPIVGATVRTSSDGVELEVLETNDAGQVTTKKRGTESVSIQTEATGYRPTTMGVDGAPATVKIFMLPQTELTVVDETGKALEGIFVGRERFGSMNLDFDRNGFPIEPNLNFGRDPKEVRTSRDGHFRLVNEITLRTLDNPVPLWAIDDNGYQFGWVWVPPADLDQPRTLKLKKTAFFEATFLIKQQTREQVYAWSLLDSSGVRIAGVAPNVSSMGSKEFCNLRFRLPPGDFSLRREIPNGNPATSVFGFKVVPDQAHVDLGLVEELSDAIDIDSEWGSVYGRVQVTNPNRIDLRPKLLLNAGGPANIQANVFSDDLLVDPQSGGLEGAFVYLAKAPSLIHPDAARIPITPLIFDQVRGRFTPHLMIVRVGQSVECVNTSTIAVNVHIYPLRNQAVNLTLRPVTKPGSGHLWMPKKGESLPMRVASDFHPWMQGYWLALDHPYAAITDKQGRFVIENLPPGEHIVKIWHERVGYIERKLNVAIERGQITAQPTITVEASTLMPQ